MTNLRVDVVSTSLNIGKQATKLFPNYSRSIVHLHKWRITPPEYIYIDLKCQGTASSDAQGIGHLIVYGIKGAQNDVDSSVYDNWFSVDNGKINMNADVDMQEHMIRNLKTPSLAKDAVNKEFLEANYMSLSGGEMKSELSMGGKRIINLASPRFDYDAANAKYVEDNYVKLKGATSNLSMNNNRITNLSQPTDSNDAVNKQFIICNISYVHLFGTVKNFGSFTINGNHQIRLHHVPIVMITIFPSTSFNNIGDTLQINLSSIYNFTHASMRRFVNINISQKFQRITGISLNKARNLQFIIVCKTLYV